MKKTILGIIVVAIAALILAGCSMTYDGQEVDPKNAQEQETTENSPNDKDGCLDDGLFY